MLQWNGKSIPQWRANVIEKRLASSRVELSEEVKVNWIPEVDFARICDIATIDALERTAHYLIMGTKAPPDAAVEFHRNRVRPLNIRPDGTFEGCNSIVFKAIMFNPLMHVVIKGCLPLDSRSGYEDMLDEQALEATILSALPEHPNLVPTLHSFSGSSSLVYPWVPSVFHDLSRSQRLVRHQTSYFVFPFYEKTLKSKYGGTTLIEEREVFLDILQVAHVLQHLSENKVAHCDFKSDNFFVSGDGTVLLGDFGCGRKLVSPSGAALTLVQAVQIVTPPPGNPNSRPPEFALMYRKLRSGEPEERFNTMEKLFCKYDMFGAGRMFVELLSGSDGAVEECLSRVPYSAELVDILRCMAHADAERRCSAEELGERVGALLWPPPRGVTQGWICQRWLEYCVDGRVSNGDGSVLPSPEVHVFAWQSLRMSSLVVEEEATVDGAVEGKLAEGVALHELNQALQQDLESCRRELREKDQSLHTFEEQMAQVLERSSALEDQVQRERRMAEEQRHAAELARRESTEQRELNQALQLDLRRELREKDHTFEKADGSGA